MSKTKKPAAATRATNSTKTEMVVVLLRRDGGASIEDLTRATNWQPHSTRAALTGLRKKGFAIDKAKVHGVTRYSIAAEPAQ